MKFSVISMDKAEQKKIDMPSQFNEPIRPDLIKRAVKAIESHNRQPYGADPEAGMKHSAFVSKRRHKFKSTYGIGQSRTPRKVMSARGTRFNWVGAVAPQTVGGRRAHPPKVSKIWDQKINKKEKRKAIRSALSATVSSEYATGRGHVVPSGYPLIVESKVEDINKTKDAVALFEKLGLSEELSRASVKKVRAGKGKARGRKYRRRVGPLVVVSADDCAAMKSFSNIPGVDVEVVEKLNAKILAPGSVPGRLTIYSEKAIARLADEKMFTENVKLVKKGAEDIVSKPKETAEAKPAVKAAAKKEEPKAKTE
jgi:large subunit ribosomal protein L4e